MTLISVLNDPHLRTKIEGQFSEKRVMERIKLNPIILFSLCGFILSLGAPIGYYLHDYVFRAQEGLSVTDHARWIHENNFSTILYIGLGTNIFFTLFGALLGRLIEKVIRQEEDLMQIKRSKDALLVQSLIRMREPTSMGIEGLMCLKKNHLREEDRQLLINTTIHELTEIDKGLQDLLLMESGQWSNTTVTSSRIMALTEEACHKNEMMVPSSARPAFRSVEVHVPEKALIQALDQTIKWVKRNELNAEEFIFSYEMNMFRLQIVLSEPPGDSDLNDALLIALIEYGKGRCFLSGKTLHLELPATAGDERAA